MLVLLAGPAFAQDGPNYVGLLDQAKAAIAAKNYKDARSFLAQAEAAAPASAQLIPEKELARLEFYKGLIEWRDGDKDTAALDRWRAAITLSENFAPEADVLPESDGQDVYYALMGEVKNRETVTLALPEDPGDVLIFVDGRKMEAFDAVYVGTHFIQLRCDGEEPKVVGSWYTYGAPPPDYLTLCTGGAYPVAKGGKAPKAPKAPKEPSAKDLAKAEKEKAAADKAAADKAAKEAAAKAAADKAAADKAAADKAATDKAAADKAAADKAAADKAAKDKATADKAAADKATADKAAADKATADKAAADKASADKAAAGKASADKAAADKASADKAAADKASADKAAADKAAADKAAADKAAADKAAKDKATADRAAADKARGDKGNTKDDGGVVGWAMIAGGGAMLAGGAVVNFVVVNPAWDEAQLANDNPGTVTRAEADGIISRFNAGRYATIGLIAAGAATAGVGVFLGPLDTHFIVTPTGVGLTGRW